MCGPGGLTLQPTGQHAPVHGEPSHGVHHVLRSDIDRHICGNVSQDIGQWLKPGLAQEQAFNREATAAQQRFERHLAFDDEAPAMA